MGEGSQESGRFAWPPSRGERGVSEAGGGRASDAARAPVEGEPRWLMWLREVEATLLPPTAVGLGERLRLAGFVPDLPDVYCPRCGESVGPHEATMGGCPACRDAPMPWSRLVRVGAYDGMLAQAIKEAKLTAFRSLARDLGYLVGRRVADAMHEAGVDPRGAIIVPVPTSFVRRIVRGIDHTREMARGAASAMGCTAVVALERRHRPSQTRLTVKARARNVAGSMTRRHGVEISDVGPVVIIDDVKTTGATLREAWRALGVVGMERRWAAVGGVATLTRRRTGVPSI